MNTGKGSLLAAGTGAPATSERIEGMDRLSPAIPASLVPAREPFAGEGPQWVVARAEKELVMRCDATGPPLGGVGPARDGFRVTNELGGPQ